MYSAPHAQRSTGRDNRAAVVRHTVGRQLLGTARGRSVVTDRPIAEGGADSGFVSGELLLIALGSCVVGSLTSAADDLGLHRSGIAARVEPVPGKTDGRPEPLLVRLSIDRPSDPEQAQRLVDVALSGAVSRRLICSSEIRVRFRNDENSE